MRLHRVCALLLAGWTVACASRSTPAPEPPKLDLKDLPAAEPGHPAIHGIVYDQRDGRRYAGALVIVTFSGSSSSPTRQRETTTDARGVYRFDDLPIGLRYEVKALHGRANSSKTLAFWLTDRAVVNFAIDPTPWTPKTWREKRQLRRWNRRFGKFYRSYP